MKPYLNQFIKADIVIKAHCWSCCRKGFH